MKLKWGKILNDPSFWVLLALNIYLVYRYEQKPQIFTTLIWLYFSQNILYGFFNFLDMFTAKKVDVSGFKFKSDEAKTDRYIANAASWVFLMHFGFFHFVYFIFLLTIKKMGAFDWDFFERFLLIFFFCQLISFIQHKIQNKKKTVDIGKMFATPYLRVVPMHLCILIPAFFRLSNLLVFLILKALTDVTMYLLTTNYYQKNDQLAKLTKMNMEAALSD